MSATAVVTWVSATGTAACSVFLTVAVLLIAGPVFDAFRDGRGTRWFVVGAAVVVVALSAAAAGLAVTVLLFLPGAGAWFRTRGPRGSA